MLGCAFHDLVVQQPAGNQGDWARVSRSLDYLTAKHIRAVTPSGLLDGTVQASLQDPPD